MRHVKEDEQVSAADADVNSHKDNYTGSCNDAAFARPPPLLSCSAQQRQQSCSSPTLLRSATKTQVECISPLSSSKAVIAAVSKLERRGMWPSQLKRMHLFWLVIGGGLCWKGMRWFTHSVQPRTRSTFGLSPTIWSAASTGNQWGGPVKLCILWFHWSAPLVSRSNRSDRRTESESGSGLSTYIWSMFMIYVLRVAQT